VILPIEFPNGEVIHAGVNIRPYADHLLAQLTSLCEVIVFTASHACYASKVLDYLDPTGKMIHHRLFRDSCVTTDEVHISNFMQGVHIKDLSILLDRDMKDVVLVDNAAYSFGF
jgi:CTD small phosphatase-like protein 2